MKAYFWFTFNKVEKADIYVFNRPGLGVFNLYYYSLLFDTKYKTFSVYFLFLMLLLFL